MFIHFHAYVPSSLYIFIYCCCWYFFYSLSLSLALVCSMSPKRKFTLSQNPLHFGASSSSDPTPSFVWFHDDEARKDFSENFCRRGIHSECHVVLSDFSNTDLPTIIHNRGWESLCDILITCPFVIIQEFYCNMHGIDTPIPHFFSCIQGTHIVVTLEIFSKVLHILSVAHPNYLSCKYLREVSKDELSSRFCETPSSWGDRQNTTCSGFAKDPKFLNMVMTFVLHPLSYYNSITELRAQFCYPS